ncbi:MAG: FKBP-type peptidyl-prolyl cis-trans isomerase [Treponema sp.]|jgi:FKBP-type peptidyl-prolyl cis-trans isomerase FkpA|nr:FKBP-type peptidyl-prolyl cis-trans isomerase [Treponema sp.]
MRKIFLIGVAAAFCAAVASAKPVYEDDSTNRAATVEEISYAFGVVLGSQFRDSGLLFNYDEVGKGFQDSFQGSAKITDDAAVDLAQAAYSEVWEKKALENKAKEEAFLAENGSKGTVIVTESGLQYEVLEEGDGPKPLADDVVRVNYEGRLMDGTVFDSSYRRGESAEFSLDMVIDGWSEGLQLMNVGSKYRLIMPSKLAYGESGAGAVVPPYSLLIFEVELLEIVDLSMEYAEEMEAFAEDPAYDEGSE